VLHISIHLDQSDRQQFPFLVGKAEERGIGPGQGCTVNLPLPPASGDDEVRTFFAKTGLGQRPGKTQQAIAFLAGVGAV
jgi:acetoin utilization deacetylase AcuC-like enzyme